MELTATATADVPFALSATPPEPTGYHDEGEFLDAVISFAPPAEPLAESKRRLWEFVQLDALMLRVEAALTPQRVKFAYELHEDLQQPEGADTSSVYDGLEETLLIADDIGRYFKEVEMRATRRIKEGIN